MGKSNAGATPASSAVPPAGIKGRRPGRFARLPRMAALLYRLGHWRPRWPQTLLVRTFILVAAVLVVTLTVSGALLQLSETEPRAKQLAELSASVVNLTRAALTNADPLYRLTLLIELSEREGLRVYPAEKEDRVEPLPDTHFFEFFREHAKTLLGANARFASAVNGEPGFWVSFRIDESDARDEYWVVLPRERAESGPAWRWLWWGASVLILALGVAWLVVAHVAKPLKRMARACLAVGRGEPPPPVDENGPHEVRVLAHALNQMSTDLQRVEQERAQVLAGISHDVRTPLARLRLALEMIDADDGLKDGMVADIEAMDGVLGQFLDYARGEASEQPTPQQPSEFAGQLASRLALRYPELHYQPAPDVASLPAVALRPRALERALTNLVDNARKYAGTELTLTVERPAPTLLAFSVSDLGSGLSEADAQRVRQPFTRGETARTGVAGTGLGLAIVDRIARLHGGSLELGPRRDGTPGLRASILIPLPA